MGQIVEIAETNQVVEVQSGVPDATSLQGNQLPSSPSDGELLRYNGTEWEHDAKTRQTVVDILANRPSPDGSDRFFWATDERQLYYDDGINWTPVRTTPDQQRQVDGSVEENLLRDAKMDADSDGDGVVDGFQKVDDVPEATFSLDQSAQKISIDGNQSSTVKPYVVAVVKRVYEGDEVGVSAEVKVANATGNAAIRAVTRALVAGGDETAGSGDQTNRQFDEYTPSSFTRVERVNTNSGLLLLPAADSAVVIVEFHAYAPAGETLDMWVRDVRIARANTSITGTYANPHVDGGSQLGHEIDTTGWPTSQEGVLVEGQTIRFGGSGTSVSGADALSEARTVASDVDSDASGNATIELDTPLTTAPADGAAVRTREKRPRLSRVESSDQLLLPDAGATWFNYPTAVYDSSSDKTIFAGASGLRHRKNGDVRIGSYDHGDGSLASFKLHDKLDPDDHSSPAILLREDGHLMAFYTDHGTDGNPLYYRASSSPGDVTSWDSEQKAVGSGNGKLTYCLAHQLPGDSDNIYVHFRQGGGRSRVVSTDGGSTWGSITDIFDVGYADIVRNGDDRLDYFVTDGHPNNKTTSLFHFYYDAVADEYYQSDGTLIGGPAALPLAHSDMTTVYDASATGHKAWNWDLYIDADGDPVVVFVEIRTEGVGGDMRYRYSRWDGSTWNGTEVAKAGGALYEGEKQYAGGIAIHDPTTLYASREVSGGWEMWKYTSDDGGSTWSGEKMPRNIDRSKNIRPHVPKNADSEIPVVWYAGGFYEDYRNYNLAVVSPLVVS